MKKNILSIFLCLSVATFAGAQTFIKANAPYWLLGLPNVAVETKLWNHFTFNQDVIVSPWKSIQGNKMMFVQCMPEFRYYPSQAFRGFYAGVYATSHIFKLTKWNYINKKVYQKGWGFGAGLNLGYQLPINERWSMDSYFSAGWQVSRYRRFDKNGNQETPLNNSGEWIPYRIGIAFAYRLGAGKI